MGIKRYIEEGKVYFVTSVTYKRKPIFKEEKFDERESKRLIKKRKIAKNRFLLTVFT